MNAVLHKKKNRLEAVFQRDDKPSLQKGVRQNNE